MEKRYVRAISKSGYTTIQGVLENQDEHTVYIIADGEPRHCMRELFDFFEINDKGVLTKWK